MRNLTSDFGAYIIDDLVGVLEILDLDHEVAFDEGETSRITPDKFPDFRNGGMRTDDFFDFFEGDGIDGGVQEDPDGLHEDVPARFHDKPDHHQGGDFLRGKIELPTHEPQQDDKGNDGVGSNMPAVRDDGGRVFLCPDLQLVGRENPGDTHGDGGGSHGGERVGQLKGPVFEEDFPNDLVTGEEDHEGDPEGDEVFDLVEPQGKSLGFAPRDPDPDEQGDGRDDVGGRMNGVGKQRDTSGKKRHDHLEGE